MGYFVHDGQKTSFDELFAGMDDLEVLVTALGREQAIRQIMAETGEPRVIVEEMADAVDSMSREAVLGLTEGEPTTLEDGLRRYVEALEKTAESQLSTEREVREEILAELRTLLTYPWPGEKITGDTSDGYHTFAELYAHRRALTAALAWKMRWVTWRSKAHHPEDQPIYPGYFIVGIDLPAGTITYHYALEHWDDFPTVPVREHAPKWDGSGPADTVTRLLELARG